MSIELIDRKSSDRLEVLSLRHNKSKGAIALRLCEKFFGRGVPHQLKTCESQKKKR